MTGFNRKSDYKGDEGFNRKSDYKGDEGFYVKSPSKKPFPRPKSPSKTDRAKFKELMGIIKRESSGGYSKTYRK